MSSFAGLLDFAGALRRELASVELSDPDATLAYELRLTRQLTAVGLRGADASHAARKLARAQVDFAGALVAARAAAAHLMDAAREVDALMENDPE